MKHPVDIDNWNRRENYLFFRDFANPYYSVTSQVDVTEAYYNRGIQMYRFPNSDVQKSVIFEGIKKRLKIV